GPAVARAPAPAASATQAKGSAYPRRRRLPRATKEIHGDQSSLPPERSLRGFYSPARHATTHVLDIPLRSVRNQGLRLIDKQIKVFAHTITVFKRKQA